MKGIKALLIATVLIGSNQVSANDYTLASGTVLIAAPTAMGGPTNQGIWFVNPMMGTFSLDLPELPANKVYEGWVVNTKYNKKVSTGLFRAAGGIDSDAAGPFAGPLKLNFPKFPGSDIVRIVKNMGDGHHAVVVTVEPYPDSDPSPSNEVVLKVDVPKGTTTGTILNLQHIVD